MDPVLPPQARPEPGWGAILARHWKQYVVLAVLAILLDLSDRLEPYQRSWPIYANKDAHYWTISYPSLPDTIPDYAVPVIAIIGPSCIIWSFLLFGKINKIEAHHATLMLLACVATTGLITNFVKVQVGQPRPDFVDRCWPKTHGLVFHKDTGTPKCEPGAKRSAIISGLRSFPSGHTSWCSAGLCFLSIWLIGRLRAFDGSAQPVRLVASLAPMLGAIWIGISRLQNNKHHVEDVVTGFLLGTLTAWLFYREVYSSLLSSKAGWLTSAVRKDGGRRRAGEAALARPLLAEEQPTSEASESAV